jgi:hypothetical protein
MTETFTITEGLVKKLLEVADEGLVKGVGEPVPGRMCVEAAVCYAMDLPHGDAPTCVSPALRALVVRLNDSAWSSDKARAKGMRRLAVAQLGSADVLDEREFARRVVEMTIRKQVPAALRAAAKIHPDSDHSARLLDAAARCEKEGTKDAADAARAVADAAAARAANAAYAAATYASYAAAYAVDDAAYVAAGAASATADATADAADAASAADNLLSEFAEDVVQILIQMKSPGTEWLWITEAQPEWLAVGKGLA